jgi:hypothetical protein
MGMLIGLFGKVEKKDGVLNCCWRVRGGRQASAARCGGG